MLSRPPRNHPVRAAHSRTVLAVIGLAAGALPPACKAKAAPVQDTEPALDTPLARDIDRICNVEEQSGALDMPPGDRAMHVGVWLATHLESQEARDLSAELSPMPAPTRGVRLKEELAKVGIKECEILYAWGTP